ncbi:MAG: class I SAM-dependent methyltransferase [Fulvivirga sp.]
MAEKFKSGEGITTEELARHLRQPQGEIGKEVGLQMNKGNKHISLNAYKLLSPLPGSHILEIGMGNGFFVNNLMEMAKNLRYTGIDFSEIMVEEANKINKILVRTGNVGFKFASVENLPFAANSFDYITTTNTIYFWPDIKENAKEVLRVLKPGGQLLIGYRPKSVMDNLEVTKYGFAKYEALEIETLLQDVGFLEVSTVAIKEPEIEFNGHAIIMEGLFTIGFKQ